MPHDPILEARPRVGKLARVIANLAAMVKKAERA